MTINERIDVLVRLGEYLTNYEEPFQAIIHRSYVENSWFTKENVEQALTAIRTSFLDREKLERWVANYNFESETPRMVGLVMAGNIPLAGFHDLLCVFVAGHKARIKLSEKDKCLLPHLIEQMSTYHKDVQNYIELVERLKGFEAVIATGSNNTARYFEAYFGKYPNIIRKNRNSLAILTGEETKEELLALGNDIFRFFGLGCRSVSKIYIPEGYDFEILFDALVPFYELIHHNKFKNNFDYNYTMLILNKVKHESNGCILLTESKALQSRIGVIHYEYYTSKDELIASLKEQAEQIQCIVSKEELAPLRVVKLGKAQYPALDDYADGVDTMAFLETI